MAASVLPNGPISRVYYLADAAPVVTNGAVT
jgi:hypothetical protein